LKKSHTKLAGSVDKVAVAIQDTRAEKTKASSTALRFEILSL